MPSHLPFTNGANSSTSSIQASRSSSYIGALPSSSSSSSTPTYPSYSRPALVARQQSAAADYRTPTPHPLPPREYGPLTSSRYHYQSRPVMPRKRESVSYTPREDHRPVRTSSPAPSSSGSSRDSLESSIKVEEQSSAEHTTPASHQGGQVADSGQTRDGEVISASTSGRKRKRLQRACVPCHKAKRRCDGGLPCSNCDFSGRSCSYADSHGNAVEPTARARPSKRPNEAVRADGGQIQNHQFSDKSETKSSEWQSLTSTPMMAGSAVRLPLPENDRHISEYLKVFRESPPVNALLPKVFHNQHEPGAILTLAISCFSSCRMSGDVATGESYAHSARKLIIDEDESRLTMLERPTVEVALTLLLLTMHEASTGKLVKAVSASMTNLNIIQEMRLNEGAGTSEHFRAPEMARLVCLAYVVELSVSTLAAKPTSLSDTDFLIATARLAYVAGGDATTGAFLALLRSARVFASVVDHQRRHTYRLLTTEEINDTRRKDSLTTWADSLPPSLAFNDGNLAEVTRILNGQPSPHRPQSQLTEDDTAWAWAWTMMHCFAEMSVFLLESHPSGASKQRNAASANIGVLVDVLNKPLRSNIVSILPLLFACQARPSSSAPLPASLYLAEAQKSQCLVDDEQLRRVLSFLGVTDPIPHPTPRPQVLDHDPREDHRGFSLKGGSASTSVSASTTSRMPAPAPRSSFQYSSANSVMGTSSRRRSTSPASVRTLPPLSISMSSVSGTSQSSQSPASPPVKGSGAMSLPASHYVHAHGSTGSANGGNGGNFSPTGPPSHLLGALDRRTSLAYGIPDHPHFSHHHRFLPPLTTLNALNASVNGSINGKPVVVGQSPVSSLSGENGTNGSTKSWTLK